MNFLNTFHEVKYNNYVASLVKNDNKYIYILDVSLMKLI